MAKLAVDGRAFPPAPPPNLDNPDVIVAHDWKAFTALSEMKDHWNRPGWYPGRRGYYWMLTFPNAPHLINLATQAQKRLTDLGLDPVPEDRLHVTLLGLGETEAVTQATVDLLVDRITQSQLSAFRLMAHPLAGSPGALRFSLSPWTPLIHLRAVLTGAGLDIGVPGGKPIEIFRPHLGIAYNNRQRPAAPVIEAAAQLRTLPPVELDVKAVDLVELRREGMAYHWRLLHRMPML